MWTVKPVTFEWVEEGHNQPDDNFQTYRKENGDYVYGIKLVMEFLEWSKGSMLSVRIFEMTDCSKRTDQVIGTKDVRAGRVDIYDDQMDVEDSLLCEAIRNGDCRGNMAQRMASNLFYKYCQDMVLKVHLPKVYEYRKSFIESFKKVTT